MLHAHYITTQRMASGYARCAYSVHCSQEEYEALFRGAPVMHNRVVAGWYDRAKNEVFMRRAGPGEIGVTIQQVRPPRNKPPSQCVSPSPEANSSTSTPAMAASVQLFLLHSARSIAIRPCLPAFPD